MQLPQFIQAIKTNDEIMVNYNLRIENSGYVTYLDITEVDI